VDESISGVLIIGFNRPDFLESCLNAVPEEYANRVFVAIDGPRNYKDKEKIEEIVSNLKERSIPSTRILLSHANLGCRRAVVSAIDWFFQHSKNGVILEDDCLASRDFFSFISSNANRVVFESNIGLISGQNPFKDQKDLKFPLQSRYPLIHGWYTTASKWRLIRKNFYNFKIVLKSTNKLEEKRKISSSIYWHAAKLRVFLGKLDTWDCFLVDQFYFLGLKSIVPRNALVKNIGNFNNGTHGSNPNLNVSINGDSSVESFDTLLETHFYRIKKKHLITPYIRIFFDVTMTLFIGKREKFIE
jgi:GR25 family glycosyltransferase involved in LPS biosynthesis